MSDKKYYSPQLDRALISPLYHEAKRKHVPMTELASQFVREGLQRSNGKSMTVEEPAEPDPAGRTD